jgi:hypothetical protein
MKRFVLLAAMAIVVCPLAGAAHAQDAAKRLTNDDVIAMVKLGLSDDLIVAKIRAVAAGGEGKAEFDTSVNGLKALKDGNVSDAVIKVMIDPTRPRRGWSPRCSR